jgi:hypothetical protein
MVWGSKVKSMVSFPVFPQWWTDEYFKVKTGRVYYNSTSTYMANTMVRDSWFIFHVREGVQLWKGEFYFIFTQERTGILQDIIKLRMTIITTIWCFDVSLFNRQEPDSVIAFVICGMQVHINYNINMGEMGNNHTNWILNVNRTVVERWTYLIERKVEQNVKGFIRLARDAP